jgi:hypothetical protein
MALRLTAHAAVVVANRGIRQEWIERVTLAPDWIEPDPDDAALVRAFGAIPEADGRILRVVYRDDAGDRVVVTVHFDRNAQTRRRARQTR